MMKLLKPLILQTLLILSKNLKLVMQSSNKWICSNLRIQILFMDSQKDSMLPVGLKDQSYLEVKNKELL
mgnify:CR=1 FL=1